MLEQGLIMPVSLEMDADSDDELEQLTEMYDQGSSGGADGSGTQVEPWTLHQCRPALSLCQQP